METRTDAAPTPLLDRPPAAIVVKAPNWLGDVVMSLPALHALRGALPAVRLAVVVERELAGLFDGVRWVDEVMAYSVRRGRAGLADRARLIADVRAHRFDLALVLPKSFQSALWMAFARVPRRAGLAAQGRSFLLTDPLPLAKGRRRHQAHDYLDLVRRTLGIDVALAAPRLESGALCRDRMRGWLDERRRRSGRLVALAPAAAYGPAKEWPAALWASLADRLADRYGAEAVLVGAPGERARCEEVAARMRAGALVAAGETAVGDLVALLSLCDGFAGNDSGAAHVAGAAGVPTVAVFGSTDPTWTAPLGPKTRVVRHPIACSPCLDRRCRFGHYQCLRSIGVDEVVAALVELGAVG